MGEIRELPHNLAKKAAVELNENPDSRSFYLNALRKWAQSQPNLKSRTTDQFLIAFLRASKFDLEKAKQKLYNFYIYRAQMPEVYGERDLNDPKVKKILNSGALLYLPIPLAADGPRIVMIRPKCFDMKSHTIPDVFKVGAMVADLLLYEDDNAIVAGYIVLMDLGNIPKSVLYHFNPNFARKITILLNKMAPTRMKGFHFLNVPSFFESLFNLVKSVISIKLRERFYVHGKTLETLYERIPRNILPQEYGGTYNMDSLIEPWWQKLNRHRKFFEEERCYGFLKECTNPRKYKKQHFEETGGCFRSLDFD